MTRYEDLLRSGGSLAAPMAHAMAEACVAAREHVVTHADHDTAVRDIAAGVAGPALIGYVLWVLGQAEQRGLRRLCFLSRDAQVFHSIAQRLAPRLGLTIQLRYVHASRRTWNLAAADPSDLSTQDWLFNSFMRSNAADVCARLGISPDEFAPHLSAVGASLDPTVRADQPQQAAALRRFAGLPVVSKAVTPRVHQMRELVREYAIQEGMASTSTGLVDAGWTGRMIGALTTVTAGLAQPKVFFWAHEPRATGWTDPSRVAAYMYNTATREGIELRVPDTPYIVETFCMSDHGIIADFEQAPDGRIAGVAENTSNPAVQEWGFDTYRSTIYRFCDALEWPSPNHALSADLRAVISRLLHAFWITPTEQEAIAWGAYPYDSDPLGRATRPLARPFALHALHAVTRGEPLDQDDRAWLQGSLAQSGPEGRQAAAILTPGYEVMGAPATD